MSSQVTHPLSAEYIAEYNGTRLVAVSIVFIPIATLFTGLRFYARYLSKASFGLDDYLSLASWMLSLGTSVLALCFVYHGGVGRHFDVWLVTDPSKVETNFKYLFTVSTFYYLPVTVPKISVLAFYNRIFTRRPYRLTILVLVGILILNAVVCIVISFNLCKPFSYYWNRSIVGGQCYNLQEFFKWSSVPNIVTDVAMLSLPLPVLWKLQTSTSVKMGLVGTFATGGLGLAGSIVKFTLFFKYNALQDGTWHQTDLMMWGSVEVYCYVIAACLITFKPLVVRLMQGRESERKTSSDQPSLQHFPSQVKRPQLSYAELLKDDAITLWDGEEAVQEKSSAARRPSLVMERGVERGRYEQLELSPTETAVQQQSNVTSSQDRAR